MQSFSQFPRLPRFYATTFNVIHNSCIRCNHNNPWSHSSEVKSSLKISESTLTLSAGKFARFADGCTVAQMGETSVMVTAVSKNKGGSSTFLPLTVDYRQKAAAAGRIPTNYLRRELGPTTSEILTSRLIDRSIRPLFPTTFKDDTQIMCNLLAVDSENDPDIVSINSASAALALSDIPWNGPVGAVRVGLVDGETIINPTRKVCAISSLNLVVSATSNNKVVMLEAAAEDISYQNLQKAIKDGTKAAQIIVKGIDELALNYGKPKRVICESAPLDEEIKSFLYEIAAEKIKTEFTNFSHHKISRDNAISEIRLETISATLEKYPDSVSTLLNDEFNSIVKVIFRNLIFETNRRCDGRSLTDLRNISCEVDMFKPLHGSALFQRGQTQVMCTTTFDSIESAAKTDAITSLIGGVKEKNFFLHYEFPPYATNETGRPGMVGRRELGHGALAERGLRPIIPNDFPFTIRLTAEVLESNGSSSMASVCAGSLALMDAGVPIKSAAAGVAIGLVTKTDPETSQIIDERILTDLLGIEDYLGDMDFKMAGTLTGITALQADIKLPGIPLATVMKAVMQANAAKQEILKIMSDTLSSPRSTRKGNGPVTDTLVIPVHQRSKFIGVGGFNIKKLSAKTGVTISIIEEGKYQLFAPNQDALDEAQEIIKKMLEEEREPDLEFGAIYSAIITEIREVGIMVQLHPALKPCLVHNSQLDHRKVNHPSVLGFTVGQEVKVKYFGRDPASGQIRLSRKVLYSPASTLINRLNKNDASS